MVSLADSHTINLNTRASCESCFWGGGLQVLGMYVLLINIDEYQRPRILPVTRAGMGFRNFRKQEEVRSG